MNGLEEIKKIIKNFVYESKELKTQISEIEKERTQLANERNEKKQYNSNDYTVEISVLGNQISELGNKSQELQNKLNAKFNDVKKIVNLTIDNIITDKIRKIRKMDEEKEDIESKIAIQNGKDIQYEARKQEFFERFGRMPELSKNAQKEEEVQEEQILFDKTKIEEINNCITNIENELTDLAAIKRNFKNGNFEYIIKPENMKSGEAIDETIELPLMEEFQIEKLEPAECMEVEEFKPIEKVELGEIEIEPIKNAYKIKENEKVKTYLEPEPIDEIELAKSIVEEIIAEQTKNMNIKELEEQEIITLEDAIKEKNEKAKLEKENITLSNIIAKIEDGEVIYKAQISNGEEINVYPTLEVKNVFLNDSEYREEIKEILVSYATSEHKNLDDTVIKKIDPTICEILDKVAKKYNYNSKKLIYNYAMSFSKTEDREKNDMMINITYNFSGLKNSNLSKKEKKVVSKICKKAIENENVDIIGGITVYNKIKYMLKKIFNINTIKALPEGKY